MSIPEALHTLEHYRKHSDDELISAMRLCASSFLRPSYVRRFKIALGLIKWDADHVYNMPHTDANAGWWADQVLYIMSNRTN